MADEELVVSFTVRELLSRIERNQAANHAELSTKLDSKADKTDVTSIRGDLEHLGKRTESLEEWRHQTEGARQQTDKHRDRWLAAAGIVAVVVAAVLTAVLTSVLA